MTIKILSQAITDELERVRHTIESQLQSGISEVDDMLKLLLNYQGKMLRPMLVILSGRMAGPIIEGQIKLGAAIEMIHLATLLHDDVLDDADRRRGKPSINHLQGNEAAVLLGDLLLSQAFYLSVEIGSLELLGYVSRTTQLICEGELSQVLRRGDYNLEEEEYFRIIAGKTASLMQCCCIQGVKLGQGNPDICQAAEQFGYNLGVAFQIMDDIKDIDNGQASFISKTLGTDMAKEKMTLPLIHYLMRSDSATRDQVRDLLRTGDQSSRHQLADRLEQFGSVQYARDRARDYIDLAKAAIRHLNDSDGLCLLADSIL